MRAKKYDLLDPQGLRQRQDSDEKMRKSTMRGLKTHHRIVERTNEIERRAWLERSNSYLEQMYEEKTTILKQIATCRSITSLVRNRWGQVLENLDVTHLGAEGDLKNLLEEVKREKRLWSNYSFEFPEWWRRLTREVTASASEGEVGEIRKPSPLETHSRKSLNDIFGSEPSQKNPLLSALKLKEEQRKKDMELERQLNEGELGLLVSSLEALVATYKLYEQARSHV